jgi:flagella basal body P-ring formation protein FlgA
MATHTKHTARHILSRGICFLAVFAFLCISAYADKITLREEAFVKGPKVTLGDIAEIEGVNAPALASVELAPAAQPGAAKYVDAALAVSRARLSGVETPIEICPTGAKRTKATTLHLEVTREMVAEELRSFIQTAMPWNPSETEIEVEPPTQSFVVPDGDLSFAWRPNPQYKYLGDGSFRCEVTVDGKVRKTLLCKARIESFSDVLVARNEISRGKLIVPGDLTVEKRAMSGMRGEICQDLSEAVGMIAKNAFLPGEVLPVSGVEKPIIIKRGQKVVTELQDGALFVRGDAVANQDAAQGETIPCINPSSKEIFMGTVRADGVIVVR